MPFKVTSGSTKVDDFGTNRKRVFDFLLVINSNLCRILHRFGDTAACRSKIANSYQPHTHSTPSLGVTPSNFGMNVISAETRMMGLPYGAETMIVDRAMWTPSMSVTSRRTDRRTDRITITKTAQRIAWRGKNRYNTAINKETQNHCPGKKPLTYIFRLKPSAIKICHFSFYDNFGKYGPVLRILSLLYSEMNRTKN